MIPMMILVSFLYAACWLPQNVLMNVLYTSLECLGEYRSIYYIYWAVHITAMSHSFVNPPIYCTRNSKFKAGWLKSVFLCIIRRFFAGFAYVFRFLPCVQYEENYSQELSLHGTYSTARSTTRYAMSVGRALLNAYEENVEITDARLESQSTID